MNTDDAAQKRLPKSPELYPAFWQNREGGLNNSAPPERGCALWFSSSYSQGFTQKHPKLLHLKTNPGWQRMTELPAEGDEVLLACCARPFGAVMAANSSAPAMKSLLRLRIFIKSSWFSDSRAGSRSCQSENPSHCKPGARQTLSLMNTDDIDQIQKN